MMMIHVDFSWVLLQMKPFHKEIFGDLLNVINLLNKLVSSQLLAEVGIWLKFNRKRNIILNQGWRWKAMPSLISM
jgi:hypothetical protein